jgi:hypothetical protein
MTMRDRSGVKVKSDVRAGGLTAQHNRRPAGVKVSSQVRAGGLTPQHNRPVLRVV